jgi:hypothetical protein
MKGIPKCSRWVKREKMKNKNSDFHTWLPTIAMYIESWLNICTTDLCEL